MALPCQPDTRLSRKVLQWLAVRRHLVDEGPKSKDICLGRLERGSARGGSTEKTNDLGAVVFKVEGGGSIVEQGHLHLGLEEDVVCGQPSVADPLRVQVGEGLRSLSQDGQLGRCRQSLPSHDCHRVQRFCLHWAGDDGKDGRLHAGAHVQHQVLLPDVCKGANFLQPSLHVLVILRTARMYDDIPVPATHVDPIMRSMTLEQSAKLQLTVLDPKVSEGEVDHLVGVASRQAG